MKKKVLSLLLAMLMVLSTVTVLPMTAFAAGTSYAITNGTPESAKEANHGYITVDETAAEGETVTITVNPAEGYQLKSLTVTPEAPATKTVADILPDGFPEEWNDGWTNSSNVDSRLYVNEGKLVAKCPYEDYPNALINLDIDSKLTPEDNNYSYTNDGIKWTFNMSGEAFGSVTISGASGDNSVLNGTYSKSECIAAGTMISMPGGRQKAVEELEIGDVICTFDHETGEVSSAPVAFIWESKNAGNAFTLTFEGDVEVTVIEEHGFYDQEEQKYVFINLQNAEEYIGHRFYNADTDSWLALKSCEALNESIDAYAIITSGHLNHMSNGMLSMCDGSVKVFANIFEYDDQMKFDADKKKADIEAYGLTSKEKILELEGFTEADYDTYNLQYVDVMIGKGLITWEWMEALSDYCVENGLVDIYSGSEAAEENEAPKMLLMSATAPKNLLGSTPEPTPQDGIEIKANENGTYTFIMPAYAVTVTAEFEEKAITIADILPDDFPTCVDVLPPNLWVNGNEVNMMVIPYSLVIFTLDGDGNPDYVELVNDIRTATLTKNGNNYTYTNNGVTTTFLMSDNGLESVKIEGLTGNYVDFNGTYGEQHAHSFTYTANNGKITATCTQGCDKGYDTTPLTLTLTAPASLVYDGNAKAFTFANGEADAWTGAGLELPTIIYYVKQSGQSTYMPLLGTLKSVGNYMAEITVNEKTAQVEFTIGKATPYIKTNPEPTDIVYGKKLSDSTLFGGYVQVSSTNTTQVGGSFEWKLGDTIPALSDSETTEYDVTFSPADTNNYNTVSCKVKIKVTHTHMGVLQNGQPATENAAGFNAYYKCDCGLYFEDKDCETEITNLSAWKAEGGAGYCAPTGAGDPEPGDEGGANLVWLWILLGILLLLIVIYVVVFFIWKKKEELPNALAFLGFLVPSYKAINNTLFKKKDDKE